MCYLLVNFGVMYVLNSGYIWVTGGCLLVMCWLCVGHVWVNWLDLYWACIRSFNGYVFAMYWLVVGYALVIIGYVLVIHLLVIG